MEECALGCARTFNDAIEAAALEALAIELGEGRFQDLAARSFGGFGLGGFCGGLLHRATTIQTSRYVCQEVCAEICFELSVLRKSLLGSYLPHLSGLAARTRKF